MLVHNTNEQRTHTHTHIQKEEIRSYGSFSENKKYVSTQRIRK